MRIAPILCGAAAAALTVFALSAPASAHDTPTAPYDAVLQDSHHDRLADYFEQDCTEVGNGVVVPGIDGWVFNAKSDDWDKAVGLTVTFGTPGGDVTILIKDGSPDAGNYPQGFYTTNNPNKAWVQVPQGWTLKDGEGKTDGTETTFVVTHTCVGTPTTPTTPPPDDKTPSPSPSPSPSEPGGDLPKTGMAVGGIVTAGVVLLGAGVALLAVRRRRNLGEL